MSTEELQRVGPSKVVDCNPDITSTKGPLVHLFQTENHKYVYDTNSNRIAQVDDSLYILLSVDGGSVTLEELEARLRESHLNLSATDARKAVARYEEFKQSGLFSKRRPKEMRRFGLPIKRMYRSALAQLIIEVTEQCNMRCRYCTYSDHYPSTRGYSTKRTSFETSTKAIDYFLGRSTDAEAPAVTFYGGEPLQEIDLIDACVAYAKRNADGRALRFQLTTNGTCLTPAVVQRLESMDMHLLVSLDGPKGAHDANRVFRGGGGTHDTVMASLRRMRCENQAYYRTHVGFSVVLTPQHDLLATQEFFDNEVDLFTDGIIAVTVVNDRGTDYWAKNPVSEDWRMAMTELRWRYYRALVNPGSKRSKFLDALFQRSFVSLFKREIAPRECDQLPLNGGCIPGTRRLYVDCAGNYHMCERIEPTLPIGNVQRGIDMNAVERVWQAYKDANERQCIDCWMSRICTKCFACAEGGEFAFPDQEKRCADLRAWANSTLVDFCEIMETNPFAFKFMDDIVVK